MNENSVIKHVKLQCIEGEHFKYWEAKLMSNDDVICEYGKINCDNPQIKVYEGGGEALLNKKMKEKLSPRKGYRQVL